MLIKKDMLHKILSEHFNKKVRIEKIEVRGEKFRGAETPIELFVEEENKEIIFDPQRYNLITFNIGRATTDENITIIRIVQGDNTIVFQYCMMSEFIETLKKVAERI
jgi:hypothetical protein